MRVSDDRGIIKVQVLNNSFSALALGMLLEHPTTYLQHPQHWIQC